MIPIVLFQSLWMFFMAGVHQQPWYAIPAGMYASQIWATPYLRQGKEMDNPLQKWLLTVLKRTLGVRDTTPSWCIMRECGLEPLQFNSVDQAGSEQQCVFIIL